MVSVIAMSERVFYVAGHRHVIEKVIKYYHVQVCVWINK